MFSKPVFEFITNSMHIEIDSIINRINDPNLNIHRARLIEMVELFTEILIAFDPLRPEPLSLMGEDNKAEKEINNHACNWMNDFDNEEKIYETIDSLRHAFSSYAYNGLHQLYTRQENEVWYPKVFLTQELTPNDIHNLEDPVTIYRGCACSEYENETYGQAWTTSIEVAAQFAFTHYQGQPWFDPNKRTVLKAQYPRDKVLFSDQSVEFEVVIQPHYLDRVEKCILHCD